MRPSIIDGPSASSPCERREEATACPCGQPEEGRVVVPEALSVAARCRSPRRQPRGESPLPLGCSSSGVGSISAVGGDTGSTGGPSDGRAGSSAGVIVALVGAHRADGTARRDAVFGDGLLAAGGVADYGFVSVIRLLFK